MDMLSEYLRAFVCGGILCLIGQILIDKTKLTPARILVSYVVSGVILGGLGIYQRIADWGGAGATGPLTGFGFNLAKGVKKAVEEKGKKMILAIHLTAVEVLEKMRKNNPVLQDLQTIEII